MTFLHTATGTALRLNKKVFCLTSLPFCSVLCKAYRTLYSPLNSIHLVVWPLSKNWNLNMQCSLSSHRNNVYNTDDKAHTLNQRHRWFSVIRPLTNGPRCLFLREHLRHLYIVAFLAWAFAFGPALLTLCSLVSVLAFVRHCVVAVAVAFSIEWICQFDDELLLCFLWVFFCLMACTSTLCTVLLALSPSLRWS